MNDCVVTAPPRSAPEPSSATDADLADVVSRITEDRHADAMNTIIGSSNDLLELESERGKRFMVKRNPSPWAAAGVAAARAASTLLERAGVLAPKPLPVPAELEAQGIEIYERIPLPTLQSLWPGLGTREREASLRSLGGLLRCIHAIRVPGYGALPQAPSERMPLQSHLANDLGVRLRPGLGWSLPEAVPAVDRMLDAMPAVARRLDGTEPRLLHGDVHLGNILCRADEHGGAACVGVLDLESAHAGPGAADLARMEALHHPLCGEPLPSGWMAQIHAGYGDVAAVADPLVRSFYAAHHFLNIAFHEAWIGRLEHARLVLAAAEAELPVGTALAVR